MLLFKSIFFGGLRIVRACVSEHIDSNNGFFGFKSFEGGVAGFTEDKLFLPQICFQCS